MNTIEETMNRANQYMDLLIRVCELYTQQNTMTKKEFYTLMEIARSKELTQ